MFVTTLMNNIRTRQQYIDDVDGDESLIEFFESQPDWQFATDDIEGAVELAKQRLMDNPQENEVGIVQLVRVVRSPKMKQEDLVVEEA